MATKLSSQPSSVHARRRAALMDRLPDIGVLTFAGGMRPRNYAANWDHFPRPYDAKCLRPGNGRKIDFPVGDHFLRPYDAKF